MKQDNLNRRGDNPFQVGVVIATKGRAGCVPHLLHLLKGQTKKPDIVVLSATRKSDLPRNMEALVNNSDLNVLQLFGPMGSSCQRNAGIRKIIDRVDVLLFIDDDFALSSGWIENCISVFKSDSQIVGMSGALLKDGAVSGPLPWDDSLAMLADHKETMTTAFPETSPIESTYGCNMAFRCSAIRGLYFDEKLVLYGWMEDNDFSRRVGKRGKLVHCTNLVGVHLGIASGRVSGKKFGYSQIINPLYLAKKGVSPLCLAILKALAPFCGNLVRALYPEKHIDRRGRLVGNMIALAELLSFQCRPERAAELA